MRVHVIIGIFILALLPRILFLNLVEFKADEALTVLEMQKFYQAPHLMYAGLVSSVGARNFPLFHYLLLLPSFFSQDPQFLSGFIGVVNAIAIALFYVITKKYYGNQPAIIASIFFATNPWSILFSRKIWAQDLIPIFAIPIYYYFHRVFRDHHRVSTIPLFIFLILTSQLHASGIFFLLIIGIYLIVKQKQYIKLACIGIIIGLIPALPYIYHQLSSTPFCPDCAAYQNASASSHSLDLVNVLMPFTLMGHLGWNSVMGATDYSNFTNTYPFSAAMYVSSFASIVCLGWGFITMYKQKKRYGGILILISCLPILYIFFQVPARLHYFQILSPFLMLTLGVGGATHPKSQAPLIWTALVGVALLNSIFMGLFYLYIAKNQGVSGDYGTPYWVSKSVVDSMTSQYHSRPDYATIRTYGFFYTHAPKNERASLIHYGLANYFYDQKDISATKQELQAILLFDTTNQRVLDTLKRLEAQ